MENTTEKVISIDLSGSIKSIADLKEAVKQYKEELKECAIGSEEAKQKNIELREAQALLTAAQNGAIEATGKLDNSYNGLVSQMAALKASWRSTTDEMERKNLAKQINSINDQLKEMDASVGNFQRNVGNYTGALETMGIKGFGAVTEGSKKVKGVWDMLKKHPFLTILAGITGIVMGIVNAVKKNEAAVRSITQAFAPLQGIMNAVANVMDKLTSSIANGVVKALDGLTSKLKSWATSMADAAEGIHMEKTAAALRSMVQSMDDASKASEMQLEIEAKIRAEEDKRATLNVELAKLQTEYQKAEGNTAKQKQIALQIEEKEKAIKQSNYNQAKEEYDLIVKQNSLTQSGQKDLNAENAAKVKMLNAEAELYKMSSQMAKTLKKEASEAQTAAAKEEAEVDKLIKKLDEWNKKQTGDNAMATSEKALEEQYRKDLELLKDNEEKKVILTAKYEEDLKALREKNAKEALAAITKTYSSESNILKQTYVDQQNEILKQYDKTNDAYKRDLALEKLKLENMREELDLGERQLKSLEDKRDEMKALGLDTVEVDNQITAVQLANSQKRQAIISEETEQLQKLDARLRTVLESSLSMMGEYVNQIASIGDGISSKWSGVFTSMASSVGALEDAFKSVGKAEMDAGEKAGAWAKAGAAACNIMSSMFSALADEQDAQTKEGFEKQKKFQIANATMTMLSGILSAWSSALNESNAWMTIYGQIAMGAAMSAMMAGVGGAQIAKIKNQSFDGGSADVGTASYNAVASLSAPTVNTQDVQTSALEERIGNQRIYVSVEEINKKQNSVRTAVSESRF